MKYIKLFENYNADKAELNVSDQKLTKLPELPDNLKELFCYVNKLTILPELPATLETLYCYNNNLTMLPELSDNLKEYRKSTTPVWLLNLQTSISAPERDPPK